MKLISIKSSFKSCLIMFSKLFYHCLIQSYIVLLSAFSGESPCRSELEAVLVVITFSFISQLLPFVFGCRRAGRSSTQVTFSPRKERPLRIKVYSESEDTPILTNRDNKNPEKIDEVRN